MEEMEVPDDGSLFGKYELGKLLGRGAFAKVYHARDVTSGQSVAVKAVSKRKVVKGGFTSNVKREITIMRRLRHPNIVRLHEVMATKSKVYVIMDFAKGGELFGKITKGRFSEDLSRRYFQQLISAVGYCHSRGVYHRDLKPENLLLDENWNLKVSDFGLSAVTSQVRHDGMLHTLCGTPAYVAPEILAKKGYDGAKVDIWSCGVILYVLNAGYLPFNDLNLMTMYRKIYSGRFRFPKWTSPGLRRLISRLLDTNVETRITVDEIIADPWFSVKYNADVSFHLDDDDVMLKEEEVDDDGGCDRALNAFDLISFSTRFDISGMFSGEAEMGCGERFVSAERAERVVEKVEEAAAGEGMRVLERRKCGVKVVGGQDGNFVVGVRVYKLTEELVVVELSKRERGEGESWEGRIWEEKVRPQLSCLVYKPEEDEDSGEEARS